MALSTYTAIAFILYGGLQVFLSVADLLLIPANLANGLYPASFEKYVVFSAVGFLVAFLPVVVGGILLLTKGRFGGLLGVLGLIISIGVASIEIVSESIVINTLVIIELVVTLLLLFLGLASWRIQSTFEIPPH
jgi:hypothetical protein